MDLEFEKVKMNRKRVAFGVEELEFKKLELMAQVARIDENIEISKQKLEELDTEIKSYNKE
jgi:hypothetical protein